MFYILLLLQAHNPFAIREPVIPWWQVLGIFAVFTVTVLGAAILKTLVSAFFEGDQTEYQETATTTETATGRTESAAVTRCQYCGVKASSSTNKCGSCGGRL